MATAIAACEKNGICNSHRRWVRGTIARPVRNVLSAGIPPDCVTVADRTRRGTTR
jgi:hypothetical protein